MKTKRRSLACLVCGLLLIAVMVVLTWQAVRRQQRQYRMNRQLIRAILNYDTDTAIALLKAGADPNTPQIADPVPPLWQQARDRILNRRPPINKSDTALLLVMDSLVDRPQKAKSDAGVPRENARLVAALLDRGANVNAVDSIHGTALGQAASWDYTDTVRILLSHGADPNIDEDGGDTALMKAAVFGDAEITRMLLEHRANPDAQDILGDTALIFARYASIDRQEAVVALLLKHHANPNLKNNKGETALKIARQKHEANIIRMLQKAGAKE